MQYQQKVINNQVTVRTQINLIIRFGCLLKIIYKVLLSINL